MNQRLLKSVRKLMILRGGEIGVFGTPGIAAQVNLLPTHFPHSFRGQGWRASARFRASLRGLHQQSSRSAGAGYVQGLSLEARDIYLHDLQRTRSAGTYELFKQTIDEFVGWMSGQFPSVRYVHEIRCAHMLSYYDVLAKKGLSLRRGETVLIPASPSTAGKKVDRVNQWIRTTLGLKPGCGRIKRTDLPRMLPAGRV